MYQFKIYFIHGIQIVSKEWYQVLLRQMTFVINTDSFSVSYAAKYFRIPIIFKDFLA